MKKVMVILLAIMMISVSACGKSDSEPTSESSKSQYVEEKKDDVEKDNVVDNEKNNEDVQQKGITFGKIDGVGNNVANMYAPKINRMKTFAFDDTYIYYDPDRTDVESGLWRVKLDGSENEIYVSEFSGSNFNIVDGVLYYSTYKDGIYTIESLNLSNKEKTKLREIGGIESMLVVKDKIFWTVRGTSSVSVCMLSLDNTSQTTTIYSNYNVPENYLYELTTDGENIYLFLFEGQTKIMILSANIEKVSETATMDIISEKTVTGNPVLEWHSYVYVWGANGVMSTWRDINSSTTTYETLLFENISDNLNSAWEPVFTLADDSDMAWIDANRPKYGIGNSLVAIQTKSEDGVQKIYFIRDMKIEDSTLVYEYHEDNLIVGGVCHDTFYIIEKTEDGMKIVSIDANGTVTEK